MRLPGAATVASILILAFVACGRSSSTAEYLLPGSDLEISVSLQRSHPILAEYQRSLSVSGASGPIAEAELFPDTGGYALVNLYRLDSGSFLVRTQGNHRYLVDPVARSLEPQITTSPKTRVRPADAKFLGAFDFDSSGRWRFIPADERGEREIGRLP